VPDIPAATQRVIEAAARKGVQLEVTYFEQSTHTAEDAARAVGAEIGQIVKSLVFVSDSIDGPEPYLVLVSGANTVDEALLAAVLTGPRLRRATAEEAREMTGFSIGGIPPFGHRRQIRTVMDPDLSRYELVWAAAGTPYAVFPVAPATLRVLANAVVTQVAAGSSTPFQEQAAGASSGA
jgi:prolyl-tRNA editing enzyme YbaK/EbsC (Cys-tRNA(Pro) deacylase)